jgi:hypothetical protein
VRLGSRFSQNEEQGNSRSHNNLSTADNNVGLTESSASPELLTTRQELEIFAFEISFDFFFIDY